MMDKYLISLNLDGTLLDDNKNVSKNTLEILNILKKKGHKILINTSRSYLRTIQIAEKIKADFISCFGGNYIFSKDKTYYVNNIPSNICKKIIQIADENNLKIIVDGLDGTFRNRLKEYSYITTNYCDLNKINFDNWFKIIVPSSNIISYFSEVINDHNLVLQYDDFNKFYCILPRNSDKLNAVKYVLNIFNNNYITMAFGDDLSDYNTLKYCDIGVKMKNSSKELSRIKFQTSSNNEGGVFKFLINFFNFDIKTNYKNVSILDCTLRDGDHLNHSKFGHSNILKIIKKLVKANVDVIELGFLEDCIYDKNVARFNTVKQAEDLVRDINNLNSMFSLLVQVDKFDIKKLEKCMGKIKFIRVSFHKNLLKRAIEYCKIIKKKGYLCSLNPINFSGYSNLEVARLMKEVNMLDLDYFYIVDTFGVLTNNSFSNKLNLINSLLRDNISLGLHLHNNLSSSFSTAQILMQKNSRYQHVLIDSSVLGMGRSPGNLKTELIMYYLNSFNKRYNLRYLYDLMEKVIPDFKNKYDWDEHFAYSISAFLKVHRSYAEYLKEKGVCYKYIDVMIKKIPTKYKDRYNEKIIENIYSEYLEVEDVFR